MRQMYISRNHDEEFKTFMALNGRVVTLKEPPKPPPSPSATGPIWKSVAFDGGVTSLEKEAIVEMLRRYRHMKEYQKP